jgi:hypothetical protein
MALIFENERIWRTLTNAWTVIFLAFVIANFFSGDRYEFLIAPMSILYTGILTLYVGTKEFDRWYERHMGRHPGEWFVLLWSVVIGALLLFSFVLGEGHRIHSDVIAVYIAVLSLFAVTQKSKSLHTKKGRARPR